MQGFKVKPGWTRSLLGGSFPFRPGRIPFFLDLCGSVADTLDKIFADHILEFLIYRKQGLMP